MQTESAQGVRIERVTVPIEWTGTRSGSRQARVTLDGEQVHLRVAKGTRGVKVGASLVVRVEYRDWYKITRTTISLLHGTSETIEERGEYNDGREHAHPTIEAVVALTS